MPWTFAHPAAVLPFRPLCPRRLSFAALVAGSLAPDFGYYTGQMGLADFAHTFAGTIAVALPTGLAALAAGSIARRPFARLLPQPHRGLLLDLPDVRIAGARAIAMVVLSVLLGAWTHVFWDAFTHHHRFFVEHVPVLRTRLFRFDGRVVFLDELLQHLSTLAGFACVAVAYRRALRRHDASRDAIDPRSERRRIAWLGLIVVLAAAWGLWAALDTDASIRRSRFTIAVVRGVVDGTAALALLLALAAALAATRDVLAKRKSRA